MTRAFGINVEPQSDESDAQVGAGRAVASPSLGGRNIFNIVVENGIGFDMEVCRKVVRKAEALKAERLAANEALREIGVDQKANNLF